ncbi:MAG: hypothetical protein AAB933_03410 [Patescibacteria group bacterium]
MRKINWLRIGVFIVLLFSTWYFLSSLGGFEGLEGNNIFQTVVFLPFWAYWLGIDNFLILLVLEMVWIYLLASIIVKLIEMLRGKVKNENQLN